MSHNLSCPRCRRPARRHDTTFTHLDQTPLCPLPDGTGPAWPVDAAALPAPVRDRAVARAYGHRDGDACRPSRLLRSVGLSVPDGPGCWLNATAAQRLIISIHRARVALPYGSVGLSGRGLDRRESRLLADWLATAPRAARGRRDAAAVTVLRAWLTWACCLYDGVSIRRRATVEPWSTWDRVTGAFHTAGARAGRDRADWWQQDTLGGRVSGPVGPLAERIQAGINDGDPAVLDALPRCDLPDPDEAGPHTNPMFDELLPPRTPCWRELKDALRREAADAYRDGFDTAVADRVAGHCRTAINNAGDPGHPHAS